MKLSIAIDILYAKLINEPYISSFSGATSSLSNVKKGNLFFVKNKLDIDEAIRLGAYGVVFEGEIEKITDSEIAWLLVENINQSIKRFVRYLLLESKSQMLLVDTIELYLAKAICGGKNTTNTINICDKTNIFESIDFFYKHYLECVENQNSFILTSISQFAYIDIPKLCSLNFLKKLESEKMQVPKNLIINTNHLKFSIVSYSLFECKVVLYGIYYKLPISYIFLPFLESLIGLLDYCATLSRLDTMLQEANLFTQAIVMKKKYYSLKDFSHFDLVEMMHFDFQNNISNLKHKVLVFCKHLQNLSYMIDSDFDYTQEIQNTMRNVLYALQVSKKESLLDVYLDTNAPHINIISCFRDKKLLGNSTKKHIKILYAHNKHLYEILAKNQFDIALIYDISKNDFIKNAQKLFKSTKSTKNSQKNFDI